MISGGVFMFKTLLAFGISAALCVQTPLARSQDFGHQAGDHEIRHVLLISIDGMHALDYENCASGIGTINSGTPYCPNLAALRKTGVNYLDATTSKPSDSFPGLTALVSGGSPRSTGAFYDVAYDRSLDPPAKTTGNGVAAGSCIPGAAPTGTTTEYEEGIDIDQTKLNGGAPSGAGGINSIDPMRLPRDPARNCEPVFPWNFVRTNTIFGIAHDSGLYTAWSDKHPSYLSVAGHGDGKNVDDYYSPEINSLVVALPGITTLTGLACSTIPDPSQTGAWTDSFQNIQCYDTLKVNAILNEIDGKTHDGKSSAPIPNLFGMNFQAVSVGQKLIEKNVGRGGHLDAIGTPSSFLLSEIQFVDAAIGEMIAHLKKQGQLHSTLIVITAKHGQSPIDPHRFFPIPGPSGINGQTPANLLDALLPTSESPTNPTGIGATEDDISLLWLKDSSKTSSAVATLEANATAAGISQIISGPALALLYNPPGLPPHGDPRTPDIIVVPNLGVVYTGSSKKLEEHGGIGHDDTNVMLLLSNPNFRAKTITSPVETMQVAPTILKALDLDPRRLDCVRLENTQVLPGLGSEDNDN
jgi:Type I phosphodiesterase / nucleotide pyrophosphatase